jgi:uncharacterized protein
MPKSRSFLPDVNVWLALASRRHIHAERCGDWLNSLESPEIVFCRVTQMGLLRLLTKEAVMGTDVLSSRDAWRTYQTILSDSRISFAAEPFDLEQEWQRLTLQRRPTPNVWTDAYLAAFARAAGLQLVTLDRAVLSLAKEALLLH